MSSVPPNLVGPIFQTHLTQQQVSAIRQNIRKQEDEAQRVRSAAGDEKEGTVGTTDEDTRVHADAQGPGSEGRGFSASEDESEDLQLPEVDNVCDQLGRYIDLEA